MGTMQGWVTRNRLREEQEQAKIEQARKEGFDDGYLAGKTFAGMEIASLRAKLEAVPVGNEDCQKAKAEGPWLAEVLKPAAPEREMPEAVDKACDLLEWGGNISAAAALRAAWRSQYAHAQPRPKLEKTRRALKCGQERLNIVFLSEETTTRWNNLFYEALAELDEWEGR